MVNSIKFTTVIFLIFHITLGIIDFDSEVNKMMIPLVEKYADAIDGFDSSEILDERVYKLIELSKDNLRDAFEILKARRNDITDISSILKLRGKTTGFIVIEDNKL